MATSQRLRTLADLETAMQAYTAEHKIEHSPVNTESVYWFVAIQEAELLFDSCTTKDLARSLREGIKSPATEQEVADWLDTHYEDMDESEWPVWNDRFEAFYGS